MRFLALVLLLFGTAHAQDVGGGTRVAGFEVSPAPAPTWATGEVDNNRQIYLSDQQGFSTQLVVQAASLVEFSDDESFLRISEERQNDSLAESELIGLHYYYASVNGMACFQYDTSIRDVSIQAPNQILNRVGYLCRHPANPELGISLEFEHRATSRVQSDIDKLRILATEFVNSSVSVADAVP